MAEESCAVFKAFLYTFCDKHKLQVAYTDEEEEAGFYCEVRVSGHDFIGHGEALGKVVAEDIAAARFVKYLVDSGLVSASQLPAPLDSVDLTLPDNSDVSSESTPVSHVTSKPLPPPALLHSTGSATPPPSLPNPPSLLAMPPPRATPYQYNTRPGLSAQPPPRQATPTATPYQYGTRPGPSAPPPPIQPMQAATPPSGGGWGQQQQRGTKRTHQQMLQQQSSGEDNGGYTIEVAKSRLHLFLQQTRQPKDMQIRPVGPDHQRSFIAEMTIYVPKMHRTIYAKEQGPTKKAVGNVLALNLVSQLYHIGAIEAAKTPGQKKSETAVEPREISLSPDILGMLRRLISDMNITPVPKPDQSGEPTSVLLPLPKREAGSGSEGERSGVVEWKPPHIDWNPWTCCSAYQTSGPYSTMEPEARATQWSEALYQEMSHRKTHDQDLCKSLQDRQSLPISSMANNIVYAVTEHPVIIVRGNTGCGKTTQVPQFILDHNIALGRGADCNIVVTQPRRISAVSVAERVAEERCEPVGVSSGYSVRFESVLPRHYASILFCTVGVLLRKLEAGLVGISHVVVDEIHERDINVMKFAVSSVTGGCGQYRRDTSLTSSW